MKNTKIDINKISFSKKPKQKWRSASCSLTDEQYKKLEQIAKSKNTNVNNFIRAILEKIIKEN